ncbi:MAG: hypothetical protein LBQ70_04295 [Prevotellaceae bacterium]|jgi:hypothetical protein|nr:hypothetical protein [Prevotellaceae bacterium]
MKKVNLFGFAVASHVLPLLLATAIFFAGCGENEENVAPVDEQEADAVSQFEVIEQELRKDGHFSIFADSLATLPTGDNIGLFTVFAIPDSIIMRNEAEFSAADVQWHTVKGEYTPEKLLSVQTLQTVEGQTLRIESDKFEIDGVETTLLYINDVPLDLSAGRPAGQNIIYPIGSNLGKISVEPDKDDLDAYNNWVALKTEGVWIIKSLEYRRYLVYRYGEYREEDPNYYRNETHVHHGCREIFQRDPTYAHQGMSGTYEARHTCGSSALANVMFFASVKPDWWAAYASYIQFSWLFGKGPMSVGRINFEPETSIGRVIVAKTGRGYDLNRLGIDDYTGPTSEYYETTITLQKVLNK